jgi:transposase-like protein
MSKKRQAFTPEFIREAVTAYRASGRPLHEVARELGIAASVLRGWHEHYDHHAAATRTTQVSTRDRITIFAALLLIGALAVFVVQPDRFTSTAEKFAILGVGVLQAEVLAVLVLGWFDRTLLDRRLIVTALALAALNVAGLLLGYARLVTLGLLLTGILFVVIWLRAGLVWLGGTFGSWLAGIK